MLVLGDGCIDKLYPDRTACIQQVAGIIVSFRLCRGGRLNEKAGWIA